jgi:hypothetical protein
MPVISVRISREAYEVYRDLAERHNMSLYSYIKWLLEEEARVLKAIGEARPLVVHLYLGDAVTEKLREIMVKRGFSGLKDALAYAVALADLVEKGVISAKRE